MKTTRTRHLVSAALALAAIAFNLEVRAQAQTETVLYDFNEAGQGEIPGSRLLVDQAGNLYGTTTYGGNTSLSNICKGVGCGVVFELSPGSSGWTEKILYTFAGGVGGGQPSSTLIFDAAGNLYGTTTLGGDLTGCTNGCGVVFKISPATGRAWTETTLYAFTGGADGSMPTATLVSDHAGNLYGTTKAGGSTVCSQGCGTVFKLSPTSGGRWHKTSLHTFLGGSSDGSQPKEGLTFDASGNLYGTATTGGAEGDGVVYRLSPGSGGWRETILYQFGGIPDDGSAPIAVLTFDAAGNLYGTTTQGGSTGYGTVFKLSRSTHVPWTETQLHVFQGFPSDGQAPGDGVVFDAAANLWGTTVYGGSQYAGTVFKLTPGSGGTWTDSVIYLGVGDGAQPEDGLIFDAAGNLYGTTTEGGTGAGYGVVFEITPDGGV
jgi:uncharacterized repeat protein (TIGR03803 family)